ncbi:PPE domain-containing protein, partial [Mycobacterium kansasii]
MADAVQPYVAWMRATAAQAEQAAAQARMVVAAYEAAVAAVVPPPLVAANRVQVASLSSTNVFGQNTARIALLEAEYGDM